MVVVEGVAVVVGVNVVVEAGVGKGECCELCCWFIQAKVVVSLTSSMEVPKLSIMDDERGTWAAAAWAAAAAATAELEDEGL